MIEAKSGRLRPIDRHPLTEAARQNGWYGLRIERGILYGCNRNFADEELEIPADIVGPDEEGSLFDLFQDGKMVIWAVHESGLRLFLMGVLDRVADQRIEVRHTDTGKPVSLSRWIGTQFKAA